MNVISLCKRLLIQDYGNQYSEEVTEIAENYKLRELLKACDKDEHTNTIGFVKHCSASPVRIPANSVTVINGTGPTLPRLYDAIVERLQTSGHLPATFIVVNTFVTVRSGHLSLRVANIGHDDIWLSPKTRVAVLMKGDVENTDNGHVKFVRSGTVEEIFVHENVHCADLLLRNQILKTLKYQLILAIYQLQVNRQIRFEPCFTTIMMCFLKMIMMLVTRLLSNIE